MIALLLPITLIPTLFMGLTVYNRARNLMLQQITDRMSIFLSEATNQMDSWLLDKSLALESMPRNPDFIESVEQYLELSPTNPEYSNVRNQTLAYLRALNTPGQDNLFNHFLLILPNGQVALSSNRPWEGIFLDETAYFQDRINTGQRASFLEITPAVLYHPETSVEYEITQFFSVPLNDSDGGLLGYVVGLSEGRQIQAILEANASFLPNNKLFLFTENQGFAGITDQTKANSISELFPSQDQLDLIFSGQPAGALANAYLSYDDTQVVGIYQYYRTLNIGFLVEVPEADVLGTINTLAPTAAIIIALTITIITALIFWVARRITNPLVDLARITQAFAQGNWSIRSNFQSTNEIGTLARSFNLMAEDLSNLYASMESTVEERTQQVITTTELSAMATSASGMNELLDQTTALIAERFGYYHIGIYLLNNEKETGTLRAASGESAHELLRQAHAISLGRDHIYYDVVRNNQPVIVSNLDRETSSINLDLLPDAHSKIAIPISIGKDVFGIIDIQSEKDSAFPHATSSVLMTLANQLAGAIYNFQLREGNQVDLQQVSQLFQTSQRLAMAESIEEIFNEIARGVQQTSYFACFYKTNGEIMALVQPAEDKPYYADQLPRELNVSGKLAVTFFSQLTPLIIKDLNNALVPMRPELLHPPRTLDAREACYIPIMIDRELFGLIILASREEDNITLNSVQPFRSLADLVQTKILKVQAQEESGIRLTNLELLTAFSESIINTTSTDLYPTIHTQVKAIIGEADFYVALYDKETDRIEIPYLYEGNQPITIDPFPLGEGLSSIVIRTRQPLMLIENAEERARALGAKVVGNSAKSWLGVPLILGDEVIGMFSVQDVQQEYRFDESDLNLMLLLAPPIAGAIQSDRLLQIAQKRSFQLETSAEIARETSTTMDQAELLRHTLQLVQDRFNFYHASIFLIEPSGEFAVVEESTGEAGQKMKEDGHKLKVGSQSIIGYVTERKTPLVVNDVTRDPTHRFNPLLPDTRAEVGIPIMLGELVIGALDVQSTTPYAFTADDIGVLQILANQLAVAINNAHLFSETQEHLAQHRLIHHVTTVAAASTNIEDALSSAVQGLRVTLGDNVSILLLDKKANQLRVLASSGYDNDVDGLLIPVGQGVTGWVAANGEPMIVNNVQADERYISGKEAVRSEIAVPLTYRGELLGVLNVESETINAYDDHDQDILGTLAGSLSAIIVNARLAERQQQLFEITNKIRQSVSMDTILETTASELTRALQARRARIQVGGDLVDAPNGGKGGNGPQARGKGGRR
jgi:GAF domain-containing protein/HAMP domain-containing protein